MAYTIAAWSGDLALPKQPYWGMSFESLEEAKRRGFDLLAWARRHEADAYVTVEEGAGDAAHMVARLPDVQLHRGDDLGRLAEEHLGRIEFVLQAWNAERYTYQEFREQLSFAVWQAQQVRAFDINT